MCCAQELAGIKNTFGAGMINNIHEMYRTNYKIVQIIIFFTVTIFFGSVITFYAYFPGLVVNDSSDQFRQAQEFQFSDWHPAIMAFIWSLTNRIIPGPLGFFLLQILLYWGGFFLVGLKIIQNEFMYHATWGNYKFVIICTLPFLPFLINICGTIWKDVLVFGCFIVALGVILWRPRTDGIWSPYSFVVFILLGIGTLARHNSIVGAVPLLVLYMWPRAPNRRCFWTVVGRGMITTVLSVFIMLSAGVLLNKTLDTRKTHIVNSIFLFDLVGISNRIDRNLVPGTWSPGEARRIRGECYTPAAWSPVSSYGDCHFVFDRLWETGAWQRGLFPLWIRAVVEYPRQYVSHRLDYMHTLLWPQTTFTLEPNSESFEYGFRENVIFKTIRNILIFTKFQFPLYFILTDGFWLIGSVILFLVLLISYLSQPQQYYQALLVAVSAAFYSVPLIVVGQAGDYRYVYWTAGATCIACLIAPWRRQVVV